MGSIGDRLGVDLGALFGGDGEASSDGAAQTGGAPDTDPKAQQGRQDDAPAPGPEISAPRPGLEDLLVEMAAELTGTPRESIQLDASFSQLDLDGLPLWAIVAEVERSTGRTFTDSTVRSWESLRDVLEAAGRSPETVE